MTIKRDILKRASRLLCIAATVALALVIVAVSPAAASKGKTKATAAPMAAGGQASATAKCPRRTHATGGGFAIANPWNPSTMTGTRAITQISQPIGGRKWFALGGAFLVADPATTFTTYARCELNSEGRVAIRLNGSATIAPSSGQTLNFTCPSGTHALSGGYSVPNPHRAGVSSSKLFVLASRRVSRRQWTIVAANPSVSPPTQLTGYVACEFNASGRVRSRSAFAPLPEDGRASASAKCKSGQHVVSGGFLVTPSTFPGPLTPAFIDNFSPAGSRKWRVDAVDFTPIAMPPGAALTTYAYCKKNTPPRR